MAKSPVSIVRVLKTPGEQEIDATGRQAIGLAGRIILILLLAVTQS